MLYNEEVGEDMLFLGEMLMGSDFDGDEPGDDSKCIVVKANMVNWI